LNPQSATRVPLIVRAPWLARGSGRCDALVELVDVLPTIAELAGIPLPANETFDGLSLLPLLGDDLRDAARRGAAFSQYPRKVSDRDRPWHGNSITHHDASLYTHMGYSVRTEGWRYTEWVVWNRSSLSPLWEEALAGAELYDHTATPPYPTDFDQSELENMVNRSELAPTVTSLSALLRAHFGNDTV